MSNKKTDVPISLMKREYHLVEKQGDKTVISNHKALNKGPGDAAVKLSQPFFKDRNDGSKVRITITKTSSGRNMGAYYEYEIVQKHMEIKDGEKVPESLIIEKNGKRYRIKRYATKLKTYTPTMMKKKTGMTSRNLSQRSSKRISSKGSKKQSKRISSKGSKKNPISNKANNKIDEMLKMNDAKGRVSKNQKTSNSSHKSKDASSESSSSSSD